MAVFAWVAGNPFDQPMDDQVFYHAVSDVSFDIFVAVADSRRWTQRKAFDLGWWYTRYILPSAVENIEEDYGEAAGLIAGTIGIFAGWAPLFATTMMAYTNPFTAAPAFVLDAFNIYRYFD